MSNFLKRLAKHTAVPFTQDNRTRDVKNLLNILLIASRLEGVTYSVVMKLLKDARWTESRRVNAWHGAKKTGIVIAVGLRRDRYIYRHIDHI